MPRCRQVSLNTKQRTAAILRVQESALLVQKRKEMKYVYIDVQ